MVKKVEYEDKVRKGSETAVPGVTDTFRAVDANELKEAVNANADVLSNSVNATELLLQTVKPLKLTLSQTLDAVQEVGSIGSTLSNVLSWTAIVNDVEAQLGTLELYRGTDLLFTNASRRSFADTFARPSSPTRIAWLLKATHADYPSVSSEAGIYVNFVRPSFAGVVNDTAIDANDIQSLTKYLSTSKALTVSGIDMNDRYFVYAYPSSYGALTSIKDQNNFEYIKAFTRTSVSVNGTTYYCYRLTDKTTVTSFTFKFS